MKINYSEPQAKTNKFNQTFESEQFPILSAYQEMDKLFTYCEYMVCIPKYTNNYNINKKFNEIKKVVNGILFCLILARYFRQINFSIKNNFINICKIIQKN